MVRAALVATLVGAGFGCGGGGGTAPEADAAVPASPRETREVLSGAGRVKGGTLVMDVQIGHPIGQRPAGGGTTTAEGNAVIKP